MNLFQKFIQIFKQAPDTQKRPVPTGYETGVYSLYDSPSAKQTEYLAEMKGWVASCVTAIADEIASINLKLFKYDKGNIVEIEEEDNDIVKLLYKVNNFTTKFDHFWLTQAYLELVGEAPWFLEREGSKIVNIYFLKPDRLTPIPDKEKLIKGYYYNVGHGERVLLQPQEVIFLKYPNPAKPFRGMGTLEMAARTVDVDTFSEEWNKSFYENAARPDSLLTVNVEQMDTEQKDKLKKSIKESYEGYKKAHQMMVLFGDMKLEKFSVSQKDMDFLEQQKFSRDKILGIFRVPKAIVAQTEGVNLASAEVAQYVFAKWTIKPKMERLIQQLNEFLLPMFPGTENMWLDYEDPVPENMESKLKYYSEGLKSGFLTINEVRDELNLPKVGGGDSIYLPMNLFPVGEVSPEGQKFLKLNYEKGEQKKKKLPIERIWALKSRSKYYFEMAKIKEEVTKKVKGMLWKEYRKIEKQRKNSEVYDQRIFSEEERKNFWEIKNNIFRKYLKRVIDAMVAIFREQRKETMAKFESLKSFKISSNEVYNTLKLNKEKETVRTIKVTLPILTELFKEAGDATFDSLGVAMEIDITDEDIVSLIGAMGRRFAVGVTETTNEKIKENVVRGIAEGQSMDEIKDKIKDVFVQAEEYRADRIARTETLRYNTSATEQAFIDSEIVEGKEWITNPSPCDACAEMAGKVAELGENFLEKGDTIHEMEIDYTDIPAPPLHPNCQCDLIPVFKPVKTIENKKEVD